MLKESASQIDNLCYKSSLIPKEIESSIDKENDEMWVAIVKRIKKLVQPRKKYINR